MALVAAGDVAAVACTRRIVDALRRRIVQQRDPAFAMSAPLGPSCAPPRSFAPAHNSPAPAPPPGALAVDLHTLGRALLHHAVLLLPSEVGTLHPSDGRTPRQQG